MPDRYNKILQVVCAALALLVLSQFFRLFLRKDPLANMSVTSAQAAPATAENKTAGKATNSTVRNSPATTNPALEPAVQARVDRITQSEILGPVVSKKPLPMALLGIGGKDAFLRAPNGQTALLREGEESGGLKLLRIGTNRVVIEHEGQQKELTLFSGFGSETLLPKGEKTPP